MPIENNHFLPLDYQEQSLLLALARDCIRCFLFTRKELSVDPQNFPPALQQEAASFVRLYLNNPRHLNNTRQQRELCGCIGTDKAWRPLVSDVIHNAHASAFEDPRFPALKKEDEGNIQIEISVLTTPVPIAFANEPDLLSQLKPDEDGVIIQEGVHRANFPPITWQHLSDRAEFMRQLKIKAGLAAQHWSDRIQVWRYRTITFSE